MTPNETAMFCNQCEQTAHGTGCEKVGVCGKSPEVSALQDLLVNAVRGLAVVARRRRGARRRHRGRGAFTADALFTTLTNVDFDAESVAGKVDEAVALREALKAASALPAARRDYDDVFANFEPAETIEGKIAQGREFGSPWDTTRDADVQSLQETTLYGMKGVGAYEHHARAARPRPTRSIYSYLFKALAAMSDENLDLNAWVGLALECGAANLRTMEILDAANTGAYGHPTPTKVVARPAQGQGDPDLRSRPRRPQGAARADQGHGHRRLHARRDAARRTPTPSCTSTRTSPATSAPRGRTSTRSSREFPGAILMTTNCLMIPHGRLQGPHLHQRPRAVPRRPAPDAR